ncbi:Dynein gamma chain [Durusdinium trenchii]|uniref:Flagellar outer arm n=1 Tax=Durusdinium trenchii TaxID=1381693 RepID=A0ABP0R6A5_9DINO
MAVRPWLMRCMVGTCLASPSFLPYCPPVELLGFLTEECQAAAALKEGMMLSFYGHIEELEWAAAEAASAGRLTMREAQDLLSFTESLNLMLCISRHRCAFSTVDDFQLAWNETCDRLLSRAPVAFSSESPCRDGNELMAVMGRLVHKLQSADVAQASTQAVYPADVAPVCQNRSQPHVTKRSRPLLFLQGTYGNHTVSSVSLSILELVEALATAQNRIMSDMVSVNLGAHDGSCGDAVEMDGANCLFDRGGRGVAIEGLELAQALHRYVSPEEASELVRMSLRKREIQEVDLLKIDLDHADCDFGRRLLEDLPPPAILHVEYNRLLPPPVRYREYFAFKKAGLMGTSWREGRQMAHWAGCSLQSWQDLAQVHQLELFQVTWMDLTFLRRDVAALLDVALIAPEPSQIFTAWLDSFCVAPSRHLYGHQAFASWDLRALADADVDVRCSLARRLWRGEGPRGSELYC